MSRNASRIGSSSFLPYDIWERICAFIPPSHLKTLYPLNRAVFHIAMNARYRHVDFTAFDDDKMRLLCHLRDPVISGLVRVLRVDTFAVFTSHCARGQTIFTSQEVVRAITLAVAGMKKLISFNVCWRSTVFSQDLVPFFTSAWRVFENSIQSLTISAPLTRLQAILGGMSTLSALGDLTIIIREDHIVPTMSHIRVQQYVLAPFVKGLRDTLHSLTIHSITDTVDLTAFFNSLVPINFTKLTRIDLKLSPTNCGLVVSPTMPHNYCNIEGHFLSFLEVHAPSLQYFAWSALTASSSSQIHADLNLVEAFNRALDTLLPLSSVQTLGLCIPSEASFPLMLKYITNTSLALTRLDLEGIDLSFDLLNQLVTCCTSQGIMIHDLRIWLDELSSRVVHLLASMPAGLSTLKLHIQPRALQLIQVTHTFLKLGEMTRPSKLRELEIRGHHLSLIEIRAMMAIFEKSFPPFKSAIESLVMDIQVLNPQLIDYLSTYANLRSFWLCMTEVTSEWQRDMGLDIYTSSSELFAQDMAHRRYSLWTSLRHIRLTSKYWELPNELHQLIDHEDLVQILARSIPSIEY